ncbi:inositol monophosphatase family protein [Streptococcus merionis]|uniref:inositol monophosphatase family protein n=1 Tax=Streptococcus merionis TaxID=400065 RepID=UPI0035151599
MTANLELSQKFDFAKSLICSAVAFLRAQMDQPFEVTEKTDFTDLVTDMDQKVQDFLMSEILAVYPEDHFLAEEGDYKQAIGSGKVWVIDPIDGTANFVAQKQDFAIVVAYYEDGIGKFGLIYDVMAEQFYYGGGDFDVFCNDEQLVPYKDKPFSQFLLAINPGMYHSNHGGVAHLAERVLGVRTYGSAALSSAKVLTGQLLGYISHISPWDYAASKIMGERLGYATVTIEGKQPNFRDREFIMIVPKVRLA